MESVAVNSVEMDYELDGWDLVWGHVALEEGRDPGSIDLTELSGQVAEAARRRFDGKPLAEHPTAAALRRLFRAAGCDPTRYRPSSEALLRRVLKGNTLPSIHPLVDLNNCLSMELAVPACVLADGSFSSPVTLRAGRAGETYESLRGPFKLEGKPVLADAAGPFGTPITDSERVKVTGETRGAWLVAYLPRGVVPTGAVPEVLEELVERVDGLRV